MSPRLNPYKAAPEAMKASVALENYVRQSGLDHSLIDLVNTRPSQINGCALLHPYDYERGARAARPRSAFICSMHGMNRRSTANASLAWTEVETLVSETHIPDVVYDQARQHFSETELVNLTLFVTAINPWNRIATSFRAAHPTRWKAGT